MKSLRYTVAAVLLASLATPVAAQQFGLTPSFNNGMHSTGPVRIFNPSRPLDAPAANPLQAQMQDDYATQLQQEQRDLLQQNPSGTTRQELAIGSQLDGFTPR